MAIDLVTLNQALDAVIKIIVLFGFFYLLLILKNLDRTVQSVERSAESIERTSEKLGKMLTVSRYLPFVGRKRNDG